MIRAIVFLVLLGANAVAQAIEIKSYNTRLDVAADGSARARVTVALAKAEAGRFRLPLGFATLDDFSPQEMPIGVTMTPLLSKDQAAVEIDLPAGVPAELSLAFHFLVARALYVPVPEEGQKSAFPEGSRLLRHSFVNTQAAPIGSYRVQVCLPEQTLVHQIREQLPKTKRKEFIPRVELDRFEGHQGATLQLAGIKQGDRTSMELEVVGENRSLGWLLAGLFLAVGYLVSFRDLVTAGKR